MRRARRRCGFMQAVRFEQVTSYHAGRDVPLYQDLNVRIAPGERAGLVGHSGSARPHS